jgi:uncharacterized protein YdaU (DUF1376 family)
MVDFAEDSGETKGVGMASTTPDHIGVAGGNEDMATPTSKRTTSPAFQFYPSDFLSSSKVDRMSMTERGVYITLLSRCWMDNGLPSDLDALAKFAKMRPQKFRRMWAAGALHECFYERSGRLLNERQERERSKQDQYRRRQSDNADMRWHSHRNAKAIPPPGSDQASGNALQSSSLSLSPSLKHKSAEPPSDSTPTIVTYPTVGKVPTYALTEGQMARWCASYPNLDVAGECRRASEWIAANPERRKTAKGMPAFLVNWLNRAVDKPRSQPSAAQSRMPMWAQKAKGLV